MVLGRSLAMGQVGLYEVILSESLSVCEAGESASEELKKCPPPSPAVLWFINVQERKPR